MSQMYKGEIRAEQRQFPRSRLQLMVHYKFLEAGEVYHALESKSDNFGTKGLSMTSDRQLREGQHLLLTLFLPPEPTTARPDNVAVAEDECLPVVVLSRVVWCLPRDTRQYQAGVEFLDVEEKHKNRLKTFLIEHHLDMDASSLYH